jgi:hypothetical protein
MATTAAATTAGLRFATRWKRPDRRQIQVEDPDGNPIELFKPARYATGGGVRCEPVEHLLSSVRHRLRPRHSDGRRRRLYGLNQRYRASN